MVKNGPFRRITYVTLWVEDVVPGTEVRVGVLGGKTQDENTIISTEFVCSKTSGNTGSICRATCSIQML